MNVVLLHYIDDFQHALAEPRIFLPSRHLFVQNHSLKRQTNSETYSKLTLQTIQWCQSRSFVSFTVNFEKISQFSGVFIVDFKQVNTGWLIGMYKQNLRSSAKSVLETKTTTKQKSYNSSNILNQL